MRFTAETRRKSDNKSQIILYLLAPHVVRIDLGSNEDRSVRASSEFPVGFSTQRLSSGGTERMSAQQNRRQPRQPISAYFCHWLPRRTGHDHVRKSLRREVLDDERRAVLAGQELVGGLVVGETLGLGVHLEPRAERHIVAGQVDAVE